MEAVGNGGEERVNDVTQPPLTSPKRTDVTQDVGCLATLSPRDILHDWRASRDHKYIKQGP